jgi:hypothetical protein
VYAQQEVKKQHMSADAKDFAALTQHSSLSHMQCAAQIDRGFMNDAGAHPSRNVSLTVQAALMSPVGAIRQPRAVSTTGMVLHL